MIIFKSIRYQNFLSAGNQFTEILLNRSKSTLIIGENGAGKSTILDALSFVLYGKAFRNINKSQLINSITNKNCLVECQFSVASKEYLIRRGQRPDIFEIYVDNSLMNQSSNIREYQDILEKTILKMNHKSFGQIVVLGSANFVPFMQLPTSIRREVIEDLLDIQIFSIMNVLLKEKISKNKNDMMLTETSIVLTENKIEMQKKNIKYLQTNNKDIIDQKNDLIQSIKTKIKETQNFIEQILSTINGLSTGISNEDKFLSKNKKILELEQQLETKLKSLKKELSFFENNDNCPTCLQSIEHAFKNNKIIKLGSQSTIVTDAIKKLEDEYTEIQLKLSDISEINNQITTHNKQITENNNKISSWIETINTLGQEIESLKSNTSIIDQNIEDIEKYNEELKKQRNDKKNIIDKKQILDMSSVLLKDSGIKTKIIKQYMPIINKLMNKYLAAMDFFVQFEIDEKFKEKIKSRFRDEFTYDSFSEGEKMRIDLSFLFTWRAIAKMKNSASTNLLIMDEVFDSSLDSSGTEEFMKILDGLTTDNNTFVISHKGDQLYDKFHSVIKFEKHSNFSRIAK
jgi:DNA repair exonuclease SbcCD ATPase subunit